MCGIFGGVGRVNPAVIRCLSLLNQSRGKDSTGFFNSSGQILKGADRADKFIVKDEFTEYLRISCKDSWCIGGHTRAATRGGVTDANAHPFQYGKIIGTHNGQVQAPVKYDVDSMYLIDLLHENNGDYQKALESVSGYFAMAWFDGEKVYLLGHNNTVHFGVLDETIYWSSDDDHLKLCGVEKIQPVNADRVVSIDRAGNIVDCPKFVAKITAVSHRYYDDDEDDLRVIGFRSHQPYSYTATDSIKRVGTYEPGTYFVLRFVSLKELRKKEIDDATDQAGERETEERLKQQELIDAGIQAGSILANEP